MIDLTNKSVDEVNGLIQKYAPVLEQIKPWNQIPHLAVVIDVGVNHIKANHADLEITWKSMSILYLKNVYLRGKISKESEIPELLDKFIAHYKSAYQEYLENVGISANDFERDYGFVRAYK